MDDSDSDDPPPPPIPLQADRGRAGKALALLGNSPPPTPQADDFAQDEAKGFMRSSFGHGAHRAALKRGMKKVRRSLIPGDIVGGDFGHGVHRKKMVGLVKKAFGAEERATSNPLSVLLLVTYIRRLQRWIRRWLRHRKLGLLRDTQRTRRVQRSISDLSKGHDLAQRRISVSLDQRAAVMHQKLMKKRAKRSAGVKHMKKLEELSESEATSDDKDAPAPTSKGAAFVASPAEPDGHPSEGAPIVVHTEIARLLNGLDNEREARETLARASMSHLAQRRAKLAAKRAHLQRVVTHFDALAPEGGGAFEHYYYFTVTCLCESC